MIRNFEKDDLQICAQLLMDTYNCEPWHNQWTVETATRYLDEFAASKKFIGFIVEEKEEVIGAMFAHRKTWYTNDEIFIDELFITPEWQGKGYGKALLKHGEEYCKRNGLAGLTLLTNRYMPAKQFYEKNQYTLAEHVAFYYKEV